MLACVFPKFQAYLNSCSIIVPKSRGEHERLFQTTSCTEMHPQLTAAPGTQPLGGCGSAVQQLPARLPGEIKPSVGETPLKMSEKTLPCLVTRWLPSRMKPSPWVPKPGAARTGSWSPGRRAAVPARIRAALVGQVWTPPEKPGLTKATETSPSLLAPAPRSVCQDVAWGRRLSVLG